jgi:predicted dehydrogenase
MLNWGTIGAGGIARVFCNGMRFSKTGQMAAVASRSKERADRLASVFSIPKRYEGYEPLLADEEIDVVYVCTIHPVHAECVIKAAEAGKHILVEKPIGMNRAEAAAMIDAARANDVFLMEAFMYRCHPQTQKLAALVRDGAIGRVQMIRSVFSYGSSFDPTSRAYANELGGGGILDVGCYTASMTRLIAGAASGEPHLEPVQVKGCAKIGPTRVDHYAAATLQFENDIVAEIITGISCQMPSEVSIYGTEGILSVPNPWLPSSPCRGAREPLPLDTVFPPSKINLWRHDAPEPEEILIEVDRDLFTYEADAVAENIVHRQSPTMSWLDTLGNIELLDRWRQEIGLVYDQDRAST